MEETDRFVDYIFVPNSDEPDESDVSDHETDGEDEVDTDDSDHKTDKFEPQSYARISENYDPSQKKLEPDHQFQWVKGEHIYDDEPTNEVLLTQKERFRIQSYSHVELFELYFSDEMKQYIIDATKENGYLLSKERLDVFLGILLQSVLNKKTSQRDYWSEHPILRCEAVATAMGRREFEAIKSHLKCSMPTDEDKNDKVWRVRKLLDLFRDRCMQFGFFTTALSVDEMMLKFFGRSVLKQFIKGKPIRSGIKMWSVCSSNGYMYNCDIYCGKNSSTNSPLSHCAQGSRVVLQMLEKLFSSHSPRKLSRFHAYFDNLFTSPDLLVHLKRIGVGATGTVRKDRVSESNEVDKKAPRGTYEVKHDVNSGINFITVMDSKPVSILSTRAGVTPLSSVKRIDKETRRKKDLPFPNAFTAYNKFMGGVDIHDQHCNKVLPMFRSKKWTWVILMRILQASITNAVVIYNTAANGADKITKKELTLSISDHYLRKSQVVPARNHVWQTSSSSRRCSGSDCEVRTWKYCEQCEKFLCKGCFPKSHS